MAMERFFTALVFCEAPLDGYGTSVLTAGKINMPVVSGGSTTKPPPMANWEDAKEQERSNGKPTAQWRAGFELAFDGLNCFDTVVMH